MGTQIGTRVFHLIVCLFGLWIGLSGLGWASEWPDTWKPFLERLTVPDAVYDPTYLGELPAESDQVLLEKFKPTLYVAPRGFVPIDFYAEYLPNTRIKSDGQPTSPIPPTRDQLKKMERQYGTYLDFVGDFDQYRADQLDWVNPVLYGRVFRETLNSNSRQDESKVPVIVLKYTPVFVASGLPDGLSPIKRIGALLAGNTTVWHELDIHGAVHIFIHGQTHQPLVVMLAQHNHFRTYVVGKDLDWPADNQLSISFAKNSNEPYLLPKNNLTKRYPTVGDPRHLRFVFTGQNGPITSGYDHVWGDQSKIVNVPYTLKFLPDHDPLYTAWIPLGDQQKLFGIFNSWFRQGPPGININAHPDLSEYVDIAAFYYFDPQDHAIFDLYEKTHADFMSADVFPVLSINQKRFGEALRPLARIQGLPN